MKFTYIFSGLYRKGYVYIDVPIADDDCIIGNYVLNNGYKPSGINTMLYLEVLVFHYDINMYYIK